MSDLRNAGKYYWHYLKRYWLGFLLSVILMPTRLGVSWWHRLTSDAPLKS